MHPIRVWDLSLPCCTPDNLFKVKIYSWILECVFSSFILHISSQKVETLMVRERERDRGACWYGCVFKRGEETVKATLSGSLENHCMWLSYQAVTHGLLHRAHSWLSPPTPNIFVVEIKLQTSSLFTVELDESIAVAETYIIWQHLRKLLRSVHIAQIMQKLVQITLCGLWKPGKYFFVVFHSCF